MIFLHLILSASNLYSYKLLYISFRYYSAQLRYRSIELLTILEKNYQASFINFFDIFFPTSLNYLPKLRKQFVTSLKSISSEDKCATAKTTQKFHQSTKKQQTEITLESSKQTNQTATLIESSSSQIFSSTLTKTPKTTATILSSPTSETSKTATSTATTSSEMMPTTAPSLPLPLLLREPTPRGRALTLSAFESFVSLKMVRIATKMKQDEHQQRYSFVFFSLIF